MTWLSQTFAGRALSFGGLWTPLGKTLVSGTRAHILQMWTMKRGLSLNPGLRLPKLRPEKWILILHSSDILLFFEFFLVLDVASFGETQCDVVVCGCWNVISPNLPLTLHVDGSRHPTLTNHCRAVYLLLNMHQIIAQITREMVDNRIILKSPRL